MAGVAPERRWAIEERGESPKAATSDLLPALGAVDQVILGLMRVRQGLVQRYVDDVEQGWGTSIGKAIFQVGEFSFGSGTDWANPRAETGRQDFAARDAQATLLQRIGEADDALDVAQIDLRPEALAKA